MKNTLFDDFTAPLADPTAGNSHQIAVELDLSERRIRQLFDQGDLVERRKGFFDIPHALQASWGRAILGNKYRQRRGPYVDAAVGWLDGCRGGGVGQAELAAWYKMAARWGLSHDAATAALMTAMGLLGEKAPEFTGAPEDPHALSED